jgi:hypothetical protein
LPHFIESVSAIEIAPVDDKKSTLKKQDSQQSLTGKKRRSETPKLEKPVDSSVQEAAPIVEGSF